MTFVMFHLLSIEWKSRRLCSPAHRIVTKTVHKTLPGSLLCLFKIGPSAVISRKFTEVIYCLLYMPPCIFDVNVINGAPGF